MYTKKLCARVMTHMYEPWHISWMSRSHHRSLFKCLISKQTSTFTIQNCDLNFDDHFEYHFIFFQERAVVESCHMCDTFVSHVYTHKHTCDYDCDTSCPTHISIVTLVATRVTRLRHGFVSHVCVFRTRISRCVWRFVSHWTHSYNCDRD